MVHKEIIYSKRHKISPQNLLIYLLVPIVVTIKHTLTLLQYWIKNRIFVLHRIFEIFILMFTPLPIEFKRQSCLYTGDLEEDTQPSFSEVRQTQINSFASGV